MLDIARCHKISLFTAMHSAWFTGSQSTYLLPHIITCSLPRALFVYNRESCLSRCRRRILLHRLSVYSLLLRELAHILPHEWGCSKGIKPFSHHVGCLAFLYSPSSHCSAQTLFVTMVWDELDKVLLVIGLIGFAIVLKNEAPKLRKWYRKRQDARPDQPGASVIQRLAAIRSPPPALLPIHLHPPIELDFWEN